MMDQWENYTRFGRRFYFLLKEGFENIPRPSDPAAVGAPFDKYGLSMISVLVDMEGEPTHITTRYNHEFNGEDNPDLHTAEQVQNITGINFYRELKPYTREELHSMGITPFEEVPELLASGEDIDEIFDDVSNRCVEFYKVKLNEKCNLLHKESNTLLCRRWYNNIMDFSEGLATVELNDKYGFIDETGREVIPCKYDWAEDFNDGLAQVCLNGKWGLVDKTGREVIPLKYNNVCLFYEGFARVNLSGKWGFIDTTGKEVIPLKYDNAWNFFEGLAPVKLNRKWGFIDKTGREVIPLKYDDAWEFIEGGLAKVKLNRKYGYIDKTGREVIPLKYDGIGKFQDGLAPVELNDKYGYIDKTGREVIPFKYDAVSPFYNGLARVQLNNKWGYIDKRGNWYGEKPSVLPESITKITISDIRYMVNECINRLI